MDGEQELIHDSMNNTVYKKYFSIFSIQKIKPNQTKTKQQQQNPYNSPLRA
jgi:hypothetical protein